MSGRIEHRAAARARERIPPHWQDFLRWHRWRFRVLLARLPNCRGRHTGVEA